MPNKILQRIGIIGDVHGQDGLLANALAHLAQIDDLSQIVCTGDIVGTEGVEPFQEAEI